MTQMRPLWLLIIVSGAALAGYLSTVGMAAAGYTSPVLPLSSVITLAAVALIVLGLGLVVWWDQRRPGRRLHPLQAVRVVAAGQACSYAGALISGWHTGVLMDLAPAAGIGTPNVTAGLMMVIGGLLWVIIGFVVETLCRIPPDQGDGLDETRYDDDGTEPHAAL